MKSTDQKQDAEVVDLAATASDKLLRDLRDHPFLAVVLYEDGSVTVFDKDIGPDEILRIREAIESKLEERTDADGS